MRDSGRFTARQEGHSTWPVPAPCPWGSCEKSRRHPNPNAISNWIHGPHLLRGCGGRSHVSVEGELCYREFVSKKQKKSKNGDQKFASPKFVSRKSPSSSGPKARFRRARTPLRANEMFVAESREHSVECRMVMNCRGLNPSKSVPDFAGVETASGKKSDLAHKMCPATGWLYSGVCITMKKIMLRGSPVAQR